MSVLGRLASALGRNDEVPNQALAKEIATAGDEKAVRELVDNLTNKAIQNDCIKVLYEIGYRKPDLIAPYADKFIDLLHSRNNRLVWGAMTALGSIVDQKAEVIAKHLPIIMEATEKGSVITHDWGIRVLAAISARDEKYEKKILPFLKTFLENCPAKDLPRHAESCIIAVKASNRSKLLPVLEARKAMLNPTQAKRIEVVIRTMNAVS